MIVKSFIRARNLRSVIYAISVMCITSVRCVNSVMSVVRLKSVFSGICVNSVMSVSQVRSGVQVLREVLHLLDQRPVIIIDGLLVL